MKLANPLEESIAQLNRNISVSKTYKKRLLDFVQELIVKLKKKEISFSEYEKLVNEKREERTIPEWIEYYDDYIKNCEELIEKKNRSIRTGKRVKSILLLLLISSAIIILFNFRTTIVGFAVNEQSISIPEFAVNDTPTSNQSTPDSIDTPEVPVIPDNEIPEIPVENLSNNNLSESTSAPSRTGRLIGTEQISSALVPTSSNQVVESGYMTEGTFTIVTIAGLDSSCYSNVSTDDTAQCLENEGTAARDAYFLWNVTLPGNNQSINWINVKSISSMATTNGSDSIGFSVFNWSSGGWVSMNRTKPAGIGINYTHTKNITLGVRDFINNTAGNMMRIVFSTNGTANFATDINAQYLEVTVNFNDTVPPTVNLSAPPNNTQTTLPSQTFNASFTDESGLVNATFYMWNSSHFLVNQTAFIITATVNSSNITINFPYNGTFYWNWRARDVDNYAFNETNGTITYNGGSPIVNLSAPPNNTFVTTPSTSFNASFIDNLALANATFYMWNSTNSIVNQTTIIITGTTNSSNITVNFPHNGTFYWNWRAGDSANNYAFNESNRTVTYDVAFPTVNLSAPPNNTLTILPSQTFNASFTNNNLANATFYMWNSTNSIVNQTTIIITGTTNSSNITVNFPHNGTFYWNWRAGDSANNYAFNETNRSLIYDGASPSVNLSAPPNNTLTILPSQTFNASFVDNLALVNATFYMWNSTNSIVNQTTLVITGTTNSSNITVNFPHNGTFYWNWRAGDSANNYAFNESNFTVTHDISFPTVNLSAPPNNTLTTLPSQTFNASFIDNLALVNATFYMWNSTSLINQTIFAIVGLTNTSNITINFPHNGTFYWNWRAGDSSHNYAFNETNRSITYSAQTLDTISPSINFTNPTPANNSMWTASNSVYVNVTSSDNLQNHTVLIDWNESLKGWWRFNNESGENESLIKDWSRQRNNGTAVNGTFYNNSGRLGKSMSFDGLDDYVELSSLPITGSGSFSIFSWVRTSNTGVRKSIVSLGANSADNDGVYFFIGVDNKVHMDVTNIAGPASDNTVADDTWHLVGVTHRVGTIQIYVDGVASGSSQSMSPNIATGGRNNKFIGVANNPGPVLYFNGSIDDVQIYSRALNETEIRAIYNATAYQYSYNFTNLSNGNHTFTSYAQDSAGNINQTEERRVEVQFTPPNSAPQIYNVSFIAATNPLEAGMRSVSINFSVSDANGASDLNSATAVANFTRSIEPVRNNQSCVQINSDGNYANYSCTINMWYFDDAGTWNITTSISDSQSAIAQNTTTTFTYNQLKAIVTSPNQINFNIDLSSENQTASNDPSTVNNTGNYNASGNLVLNAINLYSPAGFYIDVGNFTIRRTNGGSPPLECGGSFLQNGTEISLTNSALERGNLSAGLAQENIYYCIAKKIQSVPSGDYGTSSAGSWLIKINLALFSLPRRKKKSKIGNDRLLQAIDLLMEGVRGQKTENQVQVAEIIIEELKEKYNLNKKDISENITRKLKWSIPITIFKKENSFLETIVKYMKENLSMNYKDIATLLNRNERTVWTSYKKAIKKNPSRIEHEETDMYLPISIFNNDELTVMEAIVKYLRSLGKTYSEVGQIINRNQRNVWTVYSRMMKKGL